MIVESTYDAGTSNCSWTSCREGCTKELYDCTQIRVNYKLPDNTSNGADGGGRAGGGVEDDEENKRMPRYERSLGEYIEDLDENFAMDDENGLPKSFPTGADLTKLLMESISPSPNNNEGKFAGLMGNDSEWYFTGAKLFPNVKGCGYPPMLNCSIFYRQYANIGQNFSCYYSKVDPGIVISDLDMWQVYMNLVYAMAIPIPSFIISVVYLTFAYLKIYSEDEVVLVGGEEGEDGEEREGTDTPLPLTSGALTPGSEAFREDLASFGHQLKVAMADDISRESLDGIPNSLSVQGINRELMWTCGFDVDTECVREWLPATTPASSPTLPNSRVYSRILHDFTFAFTFQKLEQDDDDEYLNSPWADGSSLKRHFQGLNNISWRPH
ncbi:Protein tipE [Cyphomyrmex costatus]|uniref:Protein tipE n=1 Tax=Cyphomyrmex costatus TaxID=456900 RepID=A0A195CAH4_9HYME|nr:Protein tipE [Cyphomyrmex costatus]